MDQSFKKHEHLKSADRISAVYGSGQKLKQGYLLLFALPADGETCRIAFSVPKRRVPSAVRRNKIKRLLRESYRLQKELLPQDKPLDLVLLYLGDEAPDFAHLQKTYQKLWQKWHNRPAL